MKSSLFFITFLMAFGQTLFCQNTLDKAGLTSATPSAVAFSLRKLSSTYPGAAIKVRRSTDNAEASVAFDAAGGLSATSMVSFTPGAVVGPFGTTQTGTISSDVAKTGTITIKVNRTGTITTSNASQTVTGSGTSFTTEVVAGDKLFNGPNNVFLGVVASVSSNTALLLTNYSTGSLGTASYKTSNASVTGTGTNFTSELVTGDRIFNSSGTYLGTVASIASPTSITLNSMDAIAATAVNYKGSSATIAGTGTNFTGLSIGDLLISNNVTLGTISSIANSTSLTLTGKAGAAVQGLSFKSTPGNISFSLFYASASVYINTLYDQSGNGRDAVQLKPANQARIVNAGALYLVNARTGMEFTSSLASFLQTSTAATYLNNTLYTLNKITAEATINPALQLPISTTGGNGPNNTISHYGYRSSSQFTVAQYGNDQNFNATPSTSLEIHTSVKVSMASSQFYKNGISLGIASSGAPSHLNNAGLLNIGFYTPTNSYYNGSVSEMIVFSSALASPDLTLLNDNQLAYYNVATTYWTGAVNTNWNNTANWSTGVLPTLSIPSIVVIPTGMPRYPIITGNEVANSISLESGSSLTINGTLRIAGTINNLGTCTASTGTVQYEGSAPQSINPGTFTGNAIQNLIINNSAGVNLNGNIAVTGNLTFTTGTVSMNSSVLTIGGTVTNTVTGGLKGSSNSSLILNGTVSPTLSFDQTTPGTTNVLKFLTVNSSGQIISLANNLVLNNTGSTTFTAGKLAIGNSTLTIRGTVVNTVNGGLRGSISSNVIVDGTSSPTISFDQTVPGTTNAVNNLTVNCTGQTVTLNTSLVVGNSLNINSGIFSDGGNLVTSTGTLNLSSGTFRLGSVSVATTWPAFSTNNISLGGIVDYASGVPQIISATPQYQYLTISAVGGTTAANNLTVNGVLNLSAANPGTTSGSLSMSTYTLNMGASASTIGPGDVTGIVKRTTILPNITYTMGNEFSSITFPNTGTLPSQMSMKINIGTIPSWQAGAVARSYDYIQTGGSGTKAVISAHYLDGELNGNVENKLVDFSYRFPGSIYTEHGKSNFNTTQNYIVLSNVNVAFFSATFGNVELSFDETALTTLTWNGSTSTSWITATNWTPNGGPSTNTILIIPDAGTTPNDPYLPATASNGSVTIEQGGIVNADPAAQLTLNSPGLAWSNSGAFNAGSSHILFTNANSTINGETNFNNVTINSGAGLSMSTGSMMRIGGTITNNGTWSSGLLRNTVEYNGNNQTVLIPNGTTQSYSNLIISGTGTTVLPATFLYIRDSFVVNGAMSTIGNTVVMSGVGPQLIAGSSPVILNNLTINNGIGPVNLDQALTVGNTLTFSSGKLNVRNNTLTLSGSVINTVPNGITGSVASNLILNGTASPTLGFDMTNPGVSNALNNFTINSSSQVPLLGTDLEVGGALIFTAGKLGINGKVLTIKGDVINTVIGGIRGSGTSKLIIAGSVFSPVLSFDQSAPGTTNLVADFSINSSGREVTLNNPLLVGGSLNLTDGLILSNSINTLTLTAAATINGGSNVSFVSGPVTRYTNTTNPYAFPVGKTNLYAPVIVIPASVSAGIYNAEYFPAAGPAGTNGAGLTGIANNEYWDVSKISGPNAQVTLNYTGQSTWSLGSPTSMDYIFVAQNNSGVWQPEFGTTIPGNTGTGSTPVTSIALATLSSFTFGYSVNLVLPVTLINFKAAKVANGIDLVWTTAAEVLLAEYQLERSGDGRHFYTIGSLPAAMTNTVNKYSWLDKDPLNGLNFYRLKMKNIDGGSVFSAVLRIDVSGKKSMAVYPNPVTGNTIQLQMYGQTEGDYRCNLYNTRGDKVVSTRIRHDGYDAVKTIRLDKSLPEGVYYIEITDPQQDRITFKIFISH